MFCFPTVILLQKHGSHLEGQALFHFIILHFILMHLYLRFQNIAVALIWRSWQEYFVTAKISRRYFSVSNSRDYKTSWNDERLRHLSCLLTNGTFLWKQILLFQKAKIAFQQIWKQYCFQKSDFPAHGHVAFPKLWFAWQCT